MSKSTPPVMGVYIIRNLVSGKFYIGSSNNIKSRLANHLSKLRCGRHIALAMQADWTALGEAAFEISILETVDSMDLLRDCEQRYLDELRPFDPEIGYNRANDARGAGWQYTEEQRRGLSEAHRGRPKTAEHRANLWANREVTPEMRENMSRVGKLGRGVPKTAEHNRKNAEAQMGELCHSAKLTNAKVAVIRRRLIDGAVGAHLAEEYGVSDVTISRIKTGKIWVRVQAAPVEPTSI